ncbi:superoxide dismutase family protein [Lipingzhangella sp. LS1_29]|uniref:Superoxide dismutase family protein n=1 Tax=Lipingzhangella rawalii TaxID=2055835 RepID=A0ABU2H5H1_9ACTN|nr:superoxide dismutase family protein [Lipingzhangella rawalii]MDS1270099.1 superoxide dismutase family protein [Lipingzhangella rawalii]
MRMAGPALGLLCVGVVLSGCEDDPVSAMTEDGVFEPAPADSQGVTYDEDAVPPGAEYTVSAAPLDDGGFEVSLEVAGLEGSRDFGAHVHTDACGDDPGDSGPHYQHEEDPAVADSDDEDAVSTDPDYANPDNEIWLDFTTDEDGSASVEHAVDWEPRAGAANSVVLHAEHTATDEGVAGTAGDRLACITTEF